MLLYIASSSDRAVLLEMLEGAMEGGALREDVPVEDVEVDVESIEMGGAVEVAGEDYASALDPDEEDVEGPEIVLESGQVIGPHTPMRITPEGEEMLFVAFSLERWLANAPHGPLELGVGDAGPVLAALICNWSATVIHGLAPGPRTLLELHEAVVTLLSYETLEEHVEAMERVGLVEAETDSTGTTRYAATKWLREGLAPIAAAMRLERHFPSPDTLPPDSLDVGAGFLLTLPLLQLPKHLSGSCRLGVKLNEDGLGGKMVGVTAEITDGRIMWCDPQLEESADSWASGTAIEWLDTVVQPAVRRVATGGEKRLADALVEALHEKLFGVPIR